MEGHLGVDELTDDFLVCVCVREREKSCVVLLTIGMYTKEMNRVMGL